MPKVREGVRMRQWPHTAPESDKLQFQAASVTLHRSSPMDKIVTTLHSGTARVEELVWCITCNISRLTKYLTGSSLLWEGLTLTHSLRTQFVRRNGEDWVAGPRVLCSHLSSS